uniref:hypothetical protein n=1 Tax=uncultured Rhizobium sp. TaxID=155567 RepID=UPI00260CFED7|nr:hypothetical protein [uncultured Rhizobium sp.]
MAFPIDPETRFLIKERQRQERDIIGGRLELKDATAFSNQARVEGNRVVEPGDGFINIIALILFGVLFSGLSYFVLRWLIIIADSEYSSPTILSYIVFPLVALLFGISFHWIRDRLNLAIYAVAEIGIGMATAELALGTGNALTRLLAFLTGIRIIVDGTGRLLKFTGLWKQETK